MLNDLEFCISTINVLLKKRNLPELNSSTYKEVFSFPVKDYYQAVGFDFSKEDFSVPAKEFIDLYNEGVKDCDLFSNTTEILNGFREKGIRQFVLSAMKHDMLEKTLRQNSILDFFEGIAGLDDHFAVSKIERGEQLIKGYNIDKSLAWIIGDTIHDFEVAEQLGIKCLLIADGHQSEERLISTGSPVISSLKSLVEFDFDS